MTLIGQYSQTSTFISWFLDPFTECVSLILILANECLFVAHEREWN